MLDVTRVPNAAYQLSRSSAVWFQKRRPFKGFYHIWIWPPHWSCDLDHLNKLSFPPFHGGSIWNLASINLAVSKEKKFENVNLSDLGPRSMNDLDLWYSYRFMFLPTYRPEKYWDISGNKTFFFFFGLKARFLKASICCFFVLLIADNMLFIDFWDPML